MFGFLKPNRKLRYKLNGYRPDPAGAYWAFDREKFSFIPDSRGDVDLRQWTSPRHDQRMTSTCVAQSLVKALEIKRIMRFGKAKHVDLSVLDLYWGARDLMSPKMTNEDTGTYISLACDVLRRYGVCRESMHPFVERKLYVPPPVMATREARLNRIHSHFKLYARGYDLVDDMILNLRAGNPVIFGTAVGDQWHGYNGKKTIVPEKKWNGRHAMCVVGWVDGKFVVENSWGRSWGDDGFAYVAPEVFTDKETKDLWVIVDGSETWFEKRDK